MSKTLAELINLSRATANMQNSDFIDDDEWTYYINDAIGELHDVLTTNYDEDYLSEETVLSLTGSAYQLSNHNVKIRSFQKYQDDSSIDTYELKKFELKQLPYLRNYEGYSQRGDIITFHPSDEAPGDVLFTYVPVAQQLSGSTSTLQSKYDGGNGWDEFITLTAAMRALQKEDPSDSTPNLQRRKDALIERIKVAASNRDLSAQRRVMDTMGYLSRGSMFFGRRNRTF